jgi:DNA-binding IclR family transcriptional regulator
MVKFDMVEKKPPAKRIKTTETVFDIIEFIHEEEACSLVEIVDGLGLAKSTVHAHLVSLIERGYVVRADGKYRTGLRFLDLGTKARRNREIFKHIKPRMERFAEETGERTQFMIEEQGRGIYIYRAESSRAVPTDASIGKHRYLHTCSTGKAILAHLPQERVDEIIDEWGLPAVTQHTITDKDELMEELDQIRERGYATNKQESIKNLWAIGAAITDKNGELAGALSIGGPGHRMREENRFEEQLPNKLLGIAEEIELHITFL